MYIHDQVCKMARTQAEMSDKCSYMVFQQKRKRLLRSSLRGEIPKSCRTRLSCLPEPAAGLRGINKNGANQTQIAVC